MADTITFIITTRIIISIIKNITYYDDNCHKKISTTRRRIVSIIIDIPEEIF